MFDLSKFQYKEYNVQRFHSGLKFFKQNIEELYEVDLNPHFQRGDVWNEYQQVQFVQFVLKGGHTSPIFLNRPNENGKCVMVDGKQRTTALIKFLSNDLVVFKDETEGVGVTYSDIKSQIGYNIGIDIVLNNLSVENDVIQWFIDLNEGGTYMSKEHLTKVKQMLKK
jgi:hypothetical protein